MRKEPARNAGSQQDGYGAKLYFNSLPPILQEQLMQSTAELNTKEDLMRYCANALGRELPAPRIETKGKGLLRNAAALFHCLLAKPLPQE